MSVLKALKALISMAAVVSITYLWRLKIKMNLHTEKEGQRGRERERGGDGYGRGVKRQQRNKVLACGGSTSKVAVMS